MITLRTLAAIAALLFITGCKKDDDDAPSSGGGGTAPPSSASVQFTLDGDGFNDQVIDLTPPAGQGEARYSVDNN